MNGEVITFSDADLQGVQTPHDDAVVISLEISGYDVRRILVDNGSSADILFYDAFCQMNVPNHQQKRINSPLVGFSGSPVPVEGAITLPVTAGQGPNKSKVELNFLIVKSPSAYNAILGRPGLNTLRAIVSTYHLLMKFPTNGGIGEIRGDQALARQCYMTSLKGKQTPEALPIEGLDTRDELREQRGKPAGQLETISLIEGSEEKRTQIGSPLERETRSQLIAFLRANIDMFAWSPADMPGISPEVMTHKLNVDPMRRPIRQKKRAFAPERQQAIDQEVDKLLRAGFIREVSYPEWLANVVLVKKANGKWRACIDYTDLNKACPKDSFPLPRIDQMVDATAGYNFLSFMDAFSGYNQIRMAPEDEEKTSFITDKGLYCYKVMPFGLKNAGATYQRLMNKMFKDQIGRNMEVYVDDMLVKSREERSHISDLEEAFTVLRRYQMKLNPSKCAFGVSSGKFLGFMVSQRGIEANPEKIRAIQEMAPPKSTKDVQRLTGRVAALSRFIARSAERCLPFFKALKKVDHFEWTGECQAAFEELKEYLGSAPLLSKPTSGETLYLYLAVSSLALSSVLIKEDEKIQRPIYYVSHVLKDAETRYSKIEKVIYAVIISARKLRPYFQAHQVAIFTDLPLKSVLHRPDTSGRLAKWAVELGEFDLQYQPRTSIKAQALADFILECTIPDAAEQEQAGLSESPKENAWTLHVDGSSNTSGGGAGLVLTSPEGIVAEYALRFTFPTSNNEAEYEALLAGLKIAKDIGAPRITAYSDSQLIVGQVQGEYEAREPNMIRYLQKVKDTLPAFSHFDIRQIPRAENTRADLLSRLASSKIDELKRDIFYEVLDKPSSEACNEVLQVNVEPSWMDPLLDYLRTGHLPADKTEARRISRQASQYVIYNNHLYRRSHSMPLLKCLSPNDANYALREVHEGICGSHLGARSLAHKIFRQGYYWPTLQQDAAELVKRCDQCQRHSDIQRRPSVPLAPISAPWPFAQWGIDILGPFPVATGQRKFLVVAIDYFTKWVEAEPLAQITQSKMQNFVWRNIICRFGLPRAIISDNGRQFEGERFKGFCRDLGINQHFTSVGHPQSNGEAEVTNRTLLKGLKVRLDRTGKQWVDELDNVLWAYRTTQRIPTGETPFSLAFGTEAVIPVEIGLPSLRVESYNDQDNNEGLRTNLDLLEETREKARIRMAAYQRRAARYYNSRVKSKIFRAGDLILRRAEVSKPGESNKLSPNWEGPYQISEVVRPGTYRLTRLNGSQVPRTWNSNNLRAYYQ